MLGHSDTPNYTIYTKWLWCQELLNHPAAEASEATGVVEHARLAGGDSDWYVMGRESDAHFISFYLYMARHERRTITATSHQFVA